MSEVRLRDVTEADLEIFFQQQLDPEATRMAAFLARDRAAFMAHWTTKVLADDGVAKQTVVMDGEVAGNVVSFDQAGDLLVGYWIGRDYWGKGVATQALSLFLRLVTTRPLHAHVATHNVGSIRVLEKCGFTISPEKTADLGVPDDGVEEVVLTLAV